MILRTERAKSYDHQRMKDLYSRLGSFEAPNRFVLRNVMMIFSKLMDMR